MKYEIDTDSIASIQAAIRSGITTPELLAGVDDAAEMVEDCIVLSPGEWHADDGNAEIIEDHGDGETAAQSYVDGGDWGHDDETTWVTVRVWREGIDADGDIIAVDEESHTIAVDPSEPDCVDAQDHDWQSPHDLVGGLEENPGVQGHGGGVVIHEVCIHCGTSRLTDTWAQTPDNGVQGLTSVKYDVGEYADEVAAMTAE